MKKVLENQKTVSAIVALALAGMVTFMAVINTYGVTSSDTELSFDFDETALMERAIADMNMEDYVIEEQVVQTIKIYSNNDELLETVILSDGELVEDTETQKLLNQAEFLSEYGSTLIYRVSE